MKPPTYQKEVHQFIGVVNYYYGMWSRRSHTLEPLINITSIKVLSIVENYMLPRKSVK